MKSATLGEPLASEAPTHTTHTIPLPIGRRRTHLQVLFSLLLVGLLLVPRSACADCEWQKSKEASGITYVLVGVVIVGLFAVAALVPAFVPFALAMAAGLTLGVALAEAKDYIASFWWDPINPISSLRPPGQIYTDISDTNIDAMIPIMIHNLGSTNTITANDILSADSVQPGLGTNTLAWIRAEVRWIVAALQGAAAYNVGSQSDLSQAYNTMQMQQSVVRNEMLQVAALAEATQFPLQAGGSEPLESTPGMNGLLPTLSLNQFLQFISGTQTMGAAGLPQGEVTNLQMLIQAAQTVVPLDVGSSLAAWVADTNTCPGNFQYEVNLFLPQPANELTLSQVLTMDVDRSLTTLDLQQSPEAVPQITSFTGAGSSFSLTWTALVGSQYQVQFTPILGQPFANLGSPITATAPITTSPVPGLGTQGYYRVALMPPQ